MSRTFTTNFEPATEKVNDAFEVAFGYDDDRLLTSAGALNIARHVENGLVTGTTLGTTAEAHEYNTFGEPSRQTASANSTQVFDVQITRDDLGRITQRIEVVDGITRVFQYGYDLAGRLRAVTRNGDPVVLYTYDANGNRLGAEGEAGLVTGSYDDQDRVLTYGNATYAYTANGELATKTVAGQTTSYAYDTLGNLMQVAKPNGQVITYTIDGRGRRVGKSIDGVRVKGWLYADQLRPIAELDEYGDVTSRFVYGTRVNVPDYVIKDGVIYRIFVDHLGSPRIVVDATTGEIVQRMDFHAFGEIIQDSSPGWQPFGFAGGMHDPDTGLLRFGARDYDPLTAKWTSVDPIKFDAGDGNLFGYALGDPINRLDSSGYIAPLIGPGIGFVVGAISGAAGAIAQGSSAGDVAAAALLGGIGGAVTGASVTSRVAIAAVAGLTDLTTQLVASIGCPGARPNLGSVVGSVAAATITAGFGSRVHILKGLDSASTFVREVAKAAMGLPTAIIPLVGGALDPLSQSQNR